MIVPIVTFLGSRAAARARGPYIYQMNKAENQSLLFCCLPLLLLRLRLGKDFRVRARGWPAAVKLLQVADGRGKEQYTNIQMVTRANNGEVVKTRLPSRRAAGTYLSCLISGKVVTQWLELTSDKLVSQMVERV